VLDLMLSDDKASPFRSPPPSRTRLRRWAGDIEVGRPVEPCAHRGESAPPGPGGGAGPLVAGTPRLGCRRPPSCGCSSAEARTSSSPLGWRPESAPTMAWPLGPGPVHHW